MEPIESIDQILNDDCWKPRWGWHDDHREHGNPATSQYLPAIMQVRGEIKQLIDILGDSRTNCLQLGLGPCMACHSVWQFLFGHAVTIDQSICLMGQDSQRGLNTHDPLAKELASRYAPYDLLFIDAGHNFEDAKLDHEMYGEFVKPGGTIAFHDALPRMAYPELGVPAYLDWLSKHNVQVNIIGTEVGIAWIRK